MIFLIPVVFWRVFFFVACVGCVFTAERRFFSESSALYIRGQELRTLTIRVHNSLTTHGNSSTLKFDNFSEFQNVIKDSLPASYDALRMKTESCVTHPLTKDIFKNTLEILKLLKFAL